MKLSPLILSLFFACGLHAQTPELGPTELELQRLIQDAGLYQGEIGFIAVNLDNGHGLAEYNSAKSFIPASVQKLLTTATAVDRLGPDFQFKTDILVTGSTTDGVLNGNVIVKSSGDPTLGSKYYSSSGEVLDNITESFNGIDRINGSLIIDASHFSKYNTSRGWIWEDIGNYFGASSSSLTWKDNMLKVYLRTGQVGSRAQLASKPTGEFDFDIQVTAADGGGDNAWFFGTPNNDKIYAQGTIPAHQAKFLVKAAHPKPMDQFIADVSKALGQRDINSRIAYDPVSASQAQTQVSLYSPPLSTIVKLTNQKSINLYADALVIELATSLTHKKLEEGIHHLEAFMMKAGVYSKGTRIMDGSGLSPLNRLTPQSVVDVLRYMYRSENKDVFLSSLAEAGTSGTLRSSFKNPKLTGKVKAKSGTMKGVRNYAGYVSNKYDETVAFCIMINDYDESRKAEIMAKIEKLLIALVGG